MARGSIRVGLLWHSANSGNLGVGALTVAQIALARHAAAAKGLVPTFMIIGMKDSNCRFIKPDEADVLALDTRTLLSPGGYWAALGRLDCILDIGAGDSFSDIYGLKRFFFLWLTKALALARGKPLLFSPQTIGPFRTRLSRWLAKPVLTAARRVIARDRLSFDVVRELANRASAATCVDVAFALPYVDNASQRDGARTRVGVNVSGLLFDEARSGRNRFGLKADYAALMVDLLENLCRRPEVEVSLLTHVVDSRGGPDDDSRVADELAARFPAARRVGNFSSPTDAKSFISGLDLLIAGRMHACIAALSSGVPVIATPYSRKFSGLFGMLGYHWLAPMGEADTQDALAYLLNGIERRVEIRRDVDAAAATAAPLLDAYRVELSDFFQQSAPAHG